MLKDCDNYCPEIYRSVFIDRYNDTHVRIAPCCQAASKLESVDTFDFATSPYLTQLREQFDLGQRPVECNRCWSVEKIGHKSRRQSAIEFFQNSSLDSSVNLHSIDHSATWACNLACIMCGPNSSSLWATESDLNKTDLKKLGRLFQKSNNILDRLDLSQIKKIHFNGGEPMLNNDQTALLSKLKDLDVLKNALISYNTNGTVMPSRQVIDLWSRARLVKIFFSIDAVGSAFDYIRWPGKWEQTSKNILSMKTDLPGNVMFGFNTTIGNYNLLEMSELYQWFDQNLKYNQEGDTSDFCWQFASQNYFDLKHLPESIKLNSVEQLKNIPVLSGVVNYLNSVMNQSPNWQWVDYLNQLDATRGNSWKTALKISEFVKDHEC